MPTQRADIGFTLQALAQAAHLNIYQEDFSRKSRMDYDQGPNAPAPTSAGLKTLKGTAPALIAAICAHWDYRWQRVDGDYLFWSRTWAIDRANDTPERLIAPWRRRLKAQGAFTLDDRAEIASLFPPHLVRLTLDPALPEAGPWSPTSYHLLRLLGRLPAADREAALSGGGLALGSASPQGQTAIADDYGDSLKDVPDDQRARVVMTLRLGSGPKVPARPVALLFTLDGLTVLDVRQDLRGPQTPAVPAPRP